MRPTAEGDIPATFVSKLNKELNRVITEIWEGRSDNTDSGMLKQVGSLLESQMFEGFGKNFSNVDFTTPDAAMLTRLTRDVWNFSGAKNYQQMRDMTLALKDENGNLRTFGDFSDAAKAINGKYNATWLRTEYNQAVGSATMAARWADYEANAKTMPFLKYSTVGDMRVRDSHAELNGTVRKINDAFWSSHFPPNGWGCRCSVDQLASSTAKETENIPNIPIAPMFRTNLAKNGLIYPAAHPYYDGVPDEELRQAIYYLPPDAAYKEVYKSEETGKSVMMHILHGINEAPENIQTARILADAGHNVKLLPVLTDDKARKIIYGTDNFIKGKNPDAMVDGNIFEIKVPEHANESGIHNAIRRAKDQANKAIIRLPEAMNEIKIKQFVKGKVNQAKNLDEVWIINKTGSPIKYDRKALGL